MKEKKERKEEVLRFPIPDTNATLETTIITSTKKFNIDHKYTFFLTFPISPVNHLEAVYSIPRPVSDRDKPLGPRRLHGPE